MEENQRPLSDFITSIEQVDAPDIPSEALGEQPKKSKSKAFPIIVGILSLLILGVAGYYVYDNYIKEKDEDNGLLPEESALDYGEVLVDLENGKVLYVKVPNSGCEGFTYSSVTQEETGVFEWRENGEGSCQTVRSIAKFDDEASMTKHFSLLPDKGTLEKITVDGIEYEIVVENGLVNPLGKSGSLLYQKKPTLSVKGHEAFTLLFVYGVLPNLEERIQNPETSLTRFCAFDLSKLGDSDVTGYLVFSGDEMDINYCDVLKDSDNFELEIQQLGLL